MLFNHMCLKCAIKTYISDWIAYLCVAVNEVSLCNYLNVIHNALEILYPKNG